MAMVDPPPTRVPVHPAAGARLAVPGTGAAFDLSGKTEFIVGREDAVSQSFPDVDLAPYDGEDAGVSRLHAKLVLSGTQWMIEDLDSTNYTYVNNQKLRPDTPRPLKDGDQLRLGRFALSFHTSR